MSDEFLDSLVGCHCYPMFGGAKKRTVATTDLSIRNEWNHGLIYILHTHFFV
jgi:hypothetical protein